MNAWRLFFYGTAWLNGSAVGYNLGVKGDSLALTILLVATIIMVCIAISDSFRSN